MKDFLKHLDVQVGDFILATKSNTIELHLALVLKINATTILTSSGQRYAENVVVMDRAFISVNPELEKRADALWDTYKDKLDYTLPKPKAQAQKVRYQVRFAKDANGVFAVVEQVDVTSWQSRMDGAQKTVVGGDCEFKIVNANPGLAVSSWANRPRYLYLYERFESGKRSYQLSQSEYRFPEHTYAMAGLKKLGLENDIGKKIYLPDFKNIVAVDVKQLDEIGIKYV